MLKKLLQRTDCLLNERQRYQFFATVLINLISIAHGIGVGWLSPILRKLQSADSPLEFSLSIAEISWVGSALGMGAVTGNIFMGVALNRIGARLGLLFIAIPHSCLWILVYFAQSMEYLFVGRFLAGISSGGMYIVHPIFLSEISDAKVRGTFGSMVMLSVNIGILLGYILGTHLAYHVIPLVVLIFPLSYFISTLFFIRDSPMHLIRKRKFAAAEQSFRYYKNIKDIASSAMLEFEHMKHTLTSAAKQLDKPTLQDFFTKAALKAYGIAFVLLIVNQFSGLFAMVNYMSDIFAASGSTLNPDNCTIFIGVVQILGTYGTTLLCDIWGRKILLVVSSAGVVFSLSALGLFTYFAARYDLSDWSWLPLLCMSLYIFLGNIGLIGCFFVVLVELFPVKIRAQAASIAIVICSCFVFVMLNILPLCMANWGLPATMWSCAAITAFGFVFFVCCLNETKGKSMLED
ncbi:facilitated trehalose transporter Tret1 [Drosophila busckii]|uniref:facilitated trehalose transporter Tret1 n=1 Tax=Drosophila busckii TaxID=30019 RepID=UPI00083E9F77|nr:facilitated trehalose transporter Tret1 [Drosophila busckii]